MASSVSESKPDINKEKNGLIFVTGGHLVSAPMCVFLHNTN